MDRQLKYMIFLAVCIILCNQFVHLYRLYKEEKTQYIHQQNNLITGAIHEFNMKSTNPDNHFSFNASTNKLVYQINTQIKRFQLNTKNDIWQISKQIHYDIRHLQTWTLKNFYTYLQAKQDSINTKNLSIQFMIQDSTGQIKDAYPEHLKTLPLSPKYREPLGFISGDTMYAAYRYPAIVFIQAVIWQIILTVIISVLFIICMINFYQTIRNEKKRGEYRELFIDNL
ncbi:MAG: hypothetical protein RR034_03305, partial [Bacteroidales bacterium]